MRAHAMRTTDPAKQRRPSATVTVHPSSAEPPPADLMTREEVADFLRIHVATVDRLIKGNDLPALRLGPAHQRGAVRVRRTTLDAWVAAREVAAGSGGAR